jgi:hypothetical protein
MFPHGITVAAGTLKPVEATVGACVRARLLEIALRTLNKRYATSVEANIKTNSRRADQIATAAPPALSCQAAREGEVGET